MARKTHPLKSYHHVCVGGTFDHLHSGHQRLLKRACDIGTQVSIGVSTDALFEQKKLLKLIEPYEIRTQAVLNFLRSIGKKDHFAVFPLSDIYGTAVDDPTLEAIVVTKETKENAVKINTARSAKNYPPLEIVVVEYVRGNDEIVVRSERIRAGHIDRMGNSYLTIFTESNQLILPMRLRETLRKPLGHVISGDENDWTVAAKKAQKYLEKQNHATTIFVGDIVTESMRKIGVNPSIAICDNRTRRRSLMTKNEKTLRTFQNPAGSITRDAVMELYRLLIQDHSDTTELQIDGEEDLLALPAILLSPLGTLIFYGQFELGIIVVHVTEEKKEEIYKILLQFQKSPNF